jgi:OmpA-OmpF porin, OOP family
MKNMHRLAVVLVTGALASGCANQEIKPTTILCPLLGGVLGAGVVGAGLGGDDAGPMAAGAAVGAAMGYFLCVDRAKEPPKPAPAAAPRPAPAPAPAPAPKDSDGDGVIDPNDKCPGTPAGVKVNAEGCPEVGTKLMSLEGVNFDFDSANLRPESMAKLDEAVRVLNDNSAVSVQIEGHTDSRGSESYNQTLSEKRAQAVVDYLVSKGIAASRLTSVGRGESAPVAPNDSEENMYKNRRVDLVVTGN